MKDACTLAVNNSLQWVKFIKQTLDSAGLSYVWLNPANVDPQQIRDELKERFTDQYSMLAIRTSGDIWEAEIIQVNQGRLQEGELSSYMTVPVARLRTSAHPLRIETGRYNLPAAIPADERFCWFCQNGSVEDEFHFLFDCHLYTSIEEKSELIRYCSILNPAFTHLNNVDKWRFISLTSDSYLIYIFSKFVLTAFDLRRTSI